MIATALMMTAVCSIGQTPEQSQEQFKQGNDFYQAKDYASASKAYQTIVDQGYQSAELYHNLANAYYEQSQVAKSILYYEKALKLKDDTNTATNLQIAEEAIDDSVIEVPDFILLRLWRSIAGIFSSTLWMILQFIFGLAMVYGVYLWRIHQDATKKVKGFGLGLVSLLLLVFTYLAGNTAYKSEVIQDTGIVMTAEALLSQPSEGAEEIEKLSPGVKVRVIDAVDDWYQVLLINKEQGWMLKSGVELI